MQQQEVENYFTAVQAALEHKMIYASMNRGRLCLTHVRLVVTYVCSLHVQRILNIVFIATDPCYQRAGTSMRLDFSSSTLRCYPGYHYSVPYC